MTKKTKVRTIHVKDDEVVFIEYPKYRLPTIQILGPTTGSIKLYPLD
jgi:hypothetical protein